MSGIIQYLFFCVWLISLDIMLHSICVLMCVRISLWRLNDILLYVYITLCFPFSIDGPFGVAHFWLWWTVTVWGSLSQLLLCTSHSSEGFDLIPSPLSSSAAVPLAPWCPEGRAARPDWAGPLLPATLQSHSCHLKLDVYGWGTGC